MNKNFHRVDDANNINTDSRANPTYLRFRAVVPTCAGVHVHFLTHECTEADQFISAITMSTHTLYFDQI